ncbi:hypothetical protein CLV28_2993 [Sediminihabitans luteus]|uniref:Uncharacterized protein n=1 Tax=Sediminihabitans luteus TaxID=1138585 RepID=A0A2M9CC04_9CELL|nr:hypothetical protein [Sediminihabitans luteus]PJJ68577.1 hypothetical protein CLV28_2993 [Sediminihabitans luteus]GII99915.1 hypothetical protein Slu03_22930 [Sediminihabitans luteus]
MSSSRQPTPSWRTLLPLGRRGTAAVAAVALGLGITLTGTTAATADPAARASASTDAGALPAETPVLPGALVGAPEGATLTGTIGVTDTSLVAEAEFADGVRLVSYDRTNPAAGWVLGWGDVPATLPEGDRVVAAEGEVLVTSTSTGDVRVTWGGDGATRMLPPRSRVSQDGLEALVPGESAREWVKQTTTTGAVLGKIPVSGDLVTDLDGGLLWTTIFGSLVASDGTTRTTRRMCTSTQLDVFGRWAVGRCAAGWTVVDTSAVYATQSAIPELSELDDVRAGAGFVAGLRDAGGSGGVAVVRDSTGSHPTTTYGPVGAAPALDLDESGASFAFAGPDGVAHLVVHTPQSAPAAEVEDHVAPSAPTVNGGGEISYTNDITFYGYSTDTADPGFVPSTDLTYEVLVRERSSGAASFGDWRTVPAVSTRSWTTTAPAGSTTCVKMRADDGRGNVGGWGAEHCITIDATVPTFTSIRTHPVVKGAAGSTKVWVSWESIDAGGTSDEVYDVAYRKGRTGKGYGDWVHPSAWEGISKSGVYVSAQDGDHICFAVHVRDRVGNSGAWKKPACSYVDGTVPKMTSVTVAQPFLPAGTYGATRVRFTARDDTPVTYEVWHRAYSPHRSTDDMGKPIHGWGTAWIETVGTSTSTHAQPMGGQTECVRVRARDAVGHVSPWSLSHCASTPKVGADFNRAGLSRTAKWRPVAPGTSVRSTASLTGRTIRFTLNGGTQQGGFDVYAGSRKIGHVSAYASRSGSKVVTLKASKDFSGQLTLKQTSKYTTEIKNWVVLP